MIYIRKTKSGNTMLRSSWPYNRGNIHDRFYFRGTELYEKFISSKSVDFDELPPMRRAFRIIYKKGGKNENQN